MKPTYTLPPNENITAELLRNQALRRRTALAAAGCSTYTLGYRGGEPAIVCLACGLGSSLPHDIEQRYCGFCSAYHSEWDPGGSPP